MILRENHGCRRIAGAESTDAGSASSARSARDHGAGVDRGPRWLPQSDGPGLGVSATDRRPYPDLAATRDRPEGGPPFEAAGEDSKSFIPWIECRAADILLPDGSKNGGPGESKRLAWLAADMQPSAAIPVARCVDHLTPGACIDEFPTHPSRPDDEGMLTIPDSPGLGIEVDPDKLRRFCPEPITFR